MRAGDQIPPTVPFDGHPRPAWMSGRVVVALERLPQAAYVWDDVDPDVVWDDATPERVWDAAFVGSGYTDAWCDLVELQITTGNPDTFDGFPSGYARLILRDPGDGRYTARTADGRLVYMALGRRLAVYWLDPDDVPWWLFAGSIGTWRQARADGSVEIEAWACTADLSQPVGSTWTTGINTDLTGPRITKILAARSFTGPTRFDVGDVQLSVPAAAAALPYDVIRQAAASDGGIVFADADDTLVYRDRRWRDGRPDQTTVPVFTDNVCHLPPDAVVGWEAITADVDLRLAGTVRLENDATPTPLVATAAGSPYVPASIIWTHQYRDLWKTQADGNALAAHEAAVRSDARMALAELAVHLHDRRFDYWHQCLNLRIGDRARWQHIDSFTDPPRENLYDLEMVVTRLDQWITADTWTVTLGTAPAVDYATVEYWDTTALTWDDPVAVWR